MKSIEMMMNMKKTREFFVSLFVGGLTGIASNLLGPVCLHTRQSHMSEEEAVRMVVTSMDIIISLEAKSAGT